MFLLDAFFTLTLSSIGNANSPSAPVVADVIIIDPAGISEEVFISNSTTSSMLWITTVIVPFSSSYDAPSGKLLTLTIALFTVSPLLVDVLIVSVIVIGYSGLVSPSPFSSNVILYLITSPGTGFLSPSIGKFVDSILALIVFLGNVVYVAVYVASAVTLAISGVQPANSYLFVESEGFVGSAGLTISSAAVP